MSDSVDATTLRLSRLIELRRDDLVEVEGALFNRVDHLLKLFDLVLNGQLYRVKDGLSEQWVLHHVYLMFVVLVLVTVSCYS